MARVDFRLPAVVDLYEDDGVSIVALRGAFASDEDAAPLTRAINEAGPLLVANLISCTLLGVGALQALLRGRLNRRHGALVLVMEPGSPPWTTLGESRMLHDCHVTMTIDAARRVVRASGA